MARTWRRYGGGFFRCNPGTMKWWRRFGNKVNRQRCRLLIVNERYEDAEIVKPFGIDSWNSPDDGHILYSTNVCKVFPDGFSPAFLKIYGPVWEWERREWGIKNAK